MTPDELAKLERLEAAATPGPWSVTGGPWERTGIVDERQTEIADGPYERHADHALIVALRNSARELIGAAEERDAVAAVLTYEAIQHDEHKGPVSLAERARRVLEYWQGSSDAEDAAQTELAKLRARDAEWVATMPTCQASRCTRNATRVAPFDLPNGTGTFDANLCDECSVHRGILAGFDLPHAALIRTAGKP